MTFFWIFSLIKSQFLNILGVNIHLAANFALTRVTSCWLMPRGSLRLHQHQHYSQQQGDKNWEQQSVCTPIWHVNFFQYTVGWYGMCLKIWYTNKIQDRSSISLQDLFGECNEHQVSTEPRQRYSQLLAIATASETAPGQTFLGGLADMFSGFWAAAGRLGSLWRISLKYITLYKYHSILYICIYIHILLTMHKQWSMLVTWDIFRRYLYSNNICWFIFL